MLKQFVLFLISRVKDLYASFPAEYKAFQTCLDVNDYRFQDCRGQEIAFLDCWNTRAAAAAAAAAALSPRSDTNSPTKTA